MYKNTVFQALILLFLFCSNMGAQSITGQVNAESKPLEFASIAIVGTNWGTTTDTNGHFAFSEIPSGNYVVEVSYLGYIPATQAIDWQNDTDLALTFDLQPQADHLQEIVVTGTMKPTYVSDSPVKVDVVTAKQLETFLPAAGSSIIENIQLVNGVQEVVACGVCYTNSISINGLEGAYTAVLMDGTPIYGNLASVYGLNGIPNMIIDRFEVIKGPNSTLYGSEAVAGVINIITKDPKKQPFLSIDLMGTSHLESFGNLAIAPIIGKASGFVGLNYAYINDFDDANNDGFGDGINLDRYSLFSKWNFDRPSGKAFSLSAKYYYEDRRNGVKEYLTDRNYKHLRGSDSVYGESIVTNRLELFGTYEFNTLPNLKWDFSLSHHDQDSYYGADSYQARQHIAFSNLLWNVQLKNHDLIAGLTTRYNAYDDNTVATQQQVHGRTVNRPDNQFVSGIFVQDEWSPNNNLTILPGIRLDRYPTHGIVLAPRLSVKYKPGEWTTLRGNFGTGFRTVNLFTEDHAFITGQREVEIVETLLPERSYNGSLNLNQVYAGLGGSGTIDLESYFTHFTNKIIPDYDTPGKIIYANSDGYARTLGLGLTINHNLTIPLGINLGANIQRAIEKEPNEEGSLLTRDIQFAPRWSGLFSVNYKWQKANMVFAYTARATGPMTLPEVYDLDADGNPLSSPRPSESKPFSLHNVQVSKEWKNGLTLYGGIQNLANFRPITSPLVGFNDPNTAVGFSQYFDTSYAYAPNHGREFYLGLKWNWKYRR